MAANRRRSDRTPGLRLQSGTEVRVVERKDGMDKVQYASLFLSATGWVPADRVDIASGVEWGMTYSERDAETRRRNVAILDRPRGTVIASLASDAENFFPSGVRRIGTPKHGYTQIEFFDSGYVRVTGWVENSAIHAIQHEEMTDMGGANAPVAKAAIAEPQITLPAGELLTSTRTGDVIGVMTKPDTFHCTTACSSPTPTVAVQACGGTVVFKAVSPP